ncbi:ankyrin-1-like [Phymastichus coffea]|uniref:ankyrin-1-like n=1 Tax=Phymastichus coffea TaxID=108790 RepID=UPI00273BF7CB|nr:ankyrin-1-like [Phymastichus coffea]XP_058795394.1 ankyrin-1-like [Phymastichus coffea]XP_058795395.1 ankyrin-1-like [Phymastichus coffea]XP_058795397.1 ankyrin-1-like [Phymastichus coffea]
MFELEKRIIDDKNYIGIAQLYTLMKRSTGHDRLNKKKLLHSLYMMIDDMLDQRVDLNYRIRASYFLKTKMPHMIGSTILHLVPKECHVKTFNYLIKRGADFTVPNSRQFTALHEMMYKSNYKKCFDNGTLDNGLKPDPFVTSALLAHIEYNNSSNPCDNNGVSHFSIACMTNNVKAVEFFLDHGISVNEVHKADWSNTTGYTPLHFAVKYCADEVAEILLNRGADLTVKDSNGMTALQLLVEEKMKVWYKRTRMLSMRLSNIKRITYKTARSLIEKYERMMKLMLDNYKDDNEADVDFTRFCAACTMQDTSTLKRYLNNKAVSFKQTTSCNSLVCPGYTALHFAAHCNVKAVKLLIKNGASMEVKDAKGVTPLDICLRTFKVEDIHNIMLLREDWSNITFLNETVKLSDFIYAMRAPKLFEDFLRNKLTSMNTFVSLDSPIYSGYTPLHLAIACTETCPSNWPNRVNRLPRYLKRIKVCLILDSDVTTVNADGLTSVHQAFRLCEYDVVSHLLHYQKSMVNPVDSNGFSHFHAACVVNCKTLIKKLIKVGVNTNTPITSGFKWYKQTSVCESFVASRSTPSHLLADTGDVEMMFSMANRNKDMFVKDADGLTVVERAVKAPFKFKTCVYCTKNTSLRESDSHNDFFKLTDSNNFLESFGDYNLTFLIRDIIYEVTNSNIPRNFDALYELLHHIPNVYFNLDMIVKINTSNNSRIIVDEQILERVFKKMGITMLHLVCYKQSYKQIKEQLDNGTSANARINDNSPFYPGFTPLHFVILDWQKETFNYQLIRKNINLLLQYGADVTIANHDGNTPLHELVEKIPHNKVFNVNCYEPLIVLLKGQKDFSINPENSNGISHFHIACIVNERNMVKRFINNWIKVNQSTDHFSKKFGGYTSLHFAMIFPSEDIYSLLLRHGANVNVKDSSRNTPLHVAAKSKKCGRGEVFNCILGFGADVNAKNNMQETPLEILVINTKATPQAVIYFKQHRARVNIVNPISHEALLSHAIECLSRNESIFDELTAFPDIMNVDENGSTAMHNIVRDTYYEDPNFGSLFWNIEEKYISLHARAIEILTSLNFDVDSQDNKGMAPLHVAVENYNFDGMIGLLLNGADVNVCDTNGNTPLTYICQAYNRIPNATDHILLLNNIFTFLIIHVHILLFMKIDVNKANRDTYAKAMQKFKLNELDITNQPKKIKNFLTYSSSINLNYFLSETGVIASYPYVTKHQRQIIDEFFKDSVEILSKECPYMTCLLKLQYRKALHRAELVSKATNALNTLLGFQLPVLCSDPLMRFLTNQDLKNIDATVHVT